MVTVERRSLLGSYHLNRNGTAESEMGFAKGSQFFEGEEFMITISKVARGGTCRDLECFSQLTQGVLFLMTTWVEHTDLGLIRPSTCIIHS